MVAQESAGPNQKLCTFVTDKSLPLYGGETVLLNGQVVSLVTSAGFGHTVGQMIMFAYLPKNLWGKTAFEIEVFGDRSQITRVDGPLYDPQNDKLKA